MGIEFVAGNNKWWIPVHKNASKWPDNVDLTVKLHFHDFQFAF